MVAQDLFHIRQKLESHPLADPAGELLRRLTGWSLSKEVQGRVVVIAVPSRGIDRMTELLAALGNWLRAMGAVPVLLPAMGSHGGGTPAGQVRQLLALGFTPERTGLDVLEPGDYRPAAAYSSGESLFLPAQVRDAAGVVLVNRIKLHTLFTGSIQSGLCKLLAFGLGGPLGAAASHRQADKVGLDATVTEAVERLAISARILLGVALVEDATHQLSLVEPFPPGGLLEADRRLLPLAARFHPRLPLQSGSLLIVETMGKDFSGTGMDPHVIGRPPGTTERADFTRIFVRSLSPGSHGNALGIGYADHTLESLVRSMDRDVTMLNANTSGSLHKARIPVTHRCDRDAIEAAIGADGDGKILQIADTLHVADALAAGYSSDELAGVDVLEPLGPLAYRADGRLKHLLNEGQEECAS